MRKLSFIIFVSALSAASALNPCTPTRFEWVWAQDVIKISAPKGEALDAQASKPAQTISAEPSGSEASANPAAADYQPFNPEGDIETGLAVPVSLDLREMDIVDTIKFLATKGNLNIVATKSVAGRVTLFLNSVNLGDVLDIILLTNNLACERKKNIITVMTDAEYKALYGKAYIDKRDAKTIILKYADPANLVSVLANIKSDIGKIVADATTATIVLIDTPEKIEEMEEVIKMIDLPTISRVIPTIEETFVLSHAKAKDVSVEVTKSLTENIGSIRTDERTNTIVITDLAHNMEKIRRLIKAFDAKTKQVLVEAKVLELTLTDNSYMGIEWEKLFHQLRNLDFAGTFPFGYTGTSSMVLSVATVGADNYELALSFIKSLGETKIISTPHISVCNNEEAKFMVGTREAYVTTTTTSGEVTTTTSENVEFIDVGVTIYVTPVIGEDGFIKMELKPEISSVSDTLETTEGNEIPIVSTSNLETNVLVKDGSTIILGGLIKETLTTTVTKMPILGDIPLFGWIFRNSTDTKQKSELIILITPHIIQGDEGIFAGDWVGKKRKPKKPVKD